MKISYRKGITILEIMIVIAIIGIIATIAIPQFSKMKQLQSLKNAGEDIISTLNKAKIQTLASLDFSEYGVHFQSDRIIIFKGKSFVSDNVNNEVIEIISPAIISDISLSEGATDFYFNKLSGIPSKTGTITISIPDEENLIKTITISGTGSSSIN